MRIVVAPDSFKGSLSAQAAAEAISQGLLRVKPDLEIVQVPMADGGEGTALALVDATGGRMIEQQVTGPLGEPVGAFWGLLGDGQTAVIEMAAASGLPLVPVSRRDPRVTTTYGTGELILAALDQGARHFIIGLGGSATNDGGLGVALALGARVTDAAGQPIRQGGGSLLGAAHLDLAGLDPRLAASTFQVACDVDNPLCGQRGASAVFGPQKGATPEVVAELDRGLAHWAQLLLQATGRDVLNLPGAGAAGGLGGGLVALLGATLQPGIEIVIEAAGLREHLQGAAYVFTGEGQLDFQTAHGKTPVGVAKAAQAVGAGPVIALVGSLGQGYEDVYEAGLTAVVPIVPGPVSLETAMAKGSEYLAAAAERTLRLILRT